MSFVIATPEVMQEAAQDLAGIRSSLAEATGNLADTTTGVTAAAQDEVSIALASMLGSFGQKFHSLSAQAQAFHREFVKLVDAGAGAYISTEFANAEQTLLNAMDAPAQSLIGGAAASPAAALEDFGATVARPYQALIANTTANLQALNTAVSANPAPFLRQVLANETVFAQDLPAQLATAPADLESVVQTFTAAPVLQGIVNNQIADAQLIMSSLQNANTDFMAGVNAFPASWQAAQQAFMAGDVTGGLLQVGGGLLNPFLTGLNVIPNNDTGILTIMPVGALGDLTPILGIPGQMAQNFTNLLPNGSIPAMMAQNATHVISALTDTSQTLDLGTGNLHVGLPLVAAIDAIGPAVTTLNAIGFSSGSFVGAVQAGDGLSALTALIDAPAVIADGLLNGQATLALSASLSGVTTITNIPLGGLLTPLGFASLEIPIFGPGSIDLSGTTFGGLLPGLLTFLPEQLAEVIGAPIPVPPVSM
ncbi:MAG: PE family protein [Mycobacterium sp.]